MRMSLAPSSEASAISAPASSPMSTPWSTTHDTRTLPLGRSTSMSVTRPTFTPATLTSSPARRPEASEKTPSIVVGVLEQVEQADQEGEPGGRAEEQHRHDADHVGVAVAEGLHGAPPTMRRMAAPPRRPRPLKGTADGGADEPVVPLSRPVTIGVAHGGGVTVRHRIAWLRNSPLRDDRNVAAAFSSSRSRASSSGPSWLSTVFEGVVEALEEPVDLAAVGLEHGGEVAVERTDLEDGRLEELGVVAEGLRQGRRGCRASSRSGCRGRRRCGPRPRGCR